MTKKKRLFKLLEAAIEEMESDSIQEIYGNGAKIKIHAMTQSFSTKSIIFECVIVLGETINESVLDRTLADYVVQDTLEYFFPEHQIKTIIRWDV